jgi:hypothetical protein
MTYKFKLLLSALLFSTCLAAQAQQPPSSPAAVTQYLQAMQNQMLTMHDLSNKILAETDPNKKEDLKQQQLDLMRSQYLQMMAQQQQQQQQMQQQPQGYR